MLIPTLSLLRTKFAGVAFVLTTWLILGGSAFAESRIYNGLVAYWNFDGDLKDHAHGVSQSSFTDDTGKFFYRVNDTKSVKLVDDGFFGGAGKGEYRYGVGLVQGQKFSY